VAGDWDSITNKPSFSTVATSGSYNDLANSPVIGTIAAQAASNVAITGGTITATAINNSTIGATQPAAGRFSAIKVNGGTYNPFVLGMGPGSNIGWTNPTDTGVGPFLSSDGNHIRFLNSSSEGMRFTASKNLLINTTTDDLSNRLQVAGSAKISGGLIIKPPATNEPQIQGEVTFELTSDTTLRIRAMGTDGLIRSAIITLA
jgi:hypothetical protein